MAVVAPSSPGGLEPKSEKSGEDNAAAVPQDPPSLSSPAASDPTAPSGAAESTAAAPENPNPIPIASTPNAPVVPPRPPSVPSFTPSFRPIGAPHVPQFTPLANPNLANSSYQVPGLQPPGVSAPGAPLMHPPGVYHPPSGQMQPAPPGSYMAPNGYMPIPPPGVHRYPGPYHPGFPMPPGAPMGSIPSIHRPPIHGIRGMPPLVSSITRPPIPFVAPSEKPQTTVYVGKIASTVGNDFIESVLRLCGPVKSWKRAENPSDGTLRGFGFCEFESAEGVLRALRLLNKLNMDGQELVLNVNQATREYLERYVEKKKEREKLKEAEEDASQSGSDVQEPQKPADKKSGANEESDDKEKEDNSRKFGIVSDEDRDADKDALDKLTNMIHERMKNQPLPPPPPPSEAAALASKLTSEAASKSTDVDIIKTDTSGDKDEEMMGDTKDHDRHETSPSERARRVERSVERDRDKDLKREKEREIERFERGRERERVRREREREMKIRESERLYKELLKDWEAREREKETQRHRELEREKEKARERRREIKDQEIESDEEDTRKRRHRSSILEEKRRKRQREKEEDLADVLCEEEEIEEAKKREKEEQKLKEDSELENGGYTTALPEDHMLVEDHQEKVSVNEDNLHADKESPGNGDSAELKQENNAPSRKLGFGLMASGKRATVLSVFHQEDEGVEEKKMRPLVPIDYSAEEMQATSPGTADALPHLAAAAEFAKRISGPSHNRRDVHRDVHREKPHRGREDEENKKLLDAKQLIDMIPKTKDKLFAYQINWDIYDKHGLHERMKPWISKKITEFLGEEETTLVDYIVSSTREHVQASQMLEMLQSILDDEAEMFVLKMWRMLIFEIKKVESGLVLKTK